MRSDGGPYEPGGKMIGKSRVFRTIAICEDIRGGGGGGALLSSDEALERHESRESRFVWHHRLRRRLLTFRRDDAMQLMSSSREFMLSELPPSDSLQVTTAESGDEQ